MAGRKNMKHLSGLKQDGSPNKSWQKFEQRLYNFESVALHEWCAEEVLGYILKRYKDHYGISYTLSYSGPPSKSSELYVITRMMTMVGTKKGWILKQYVDWVFETQIIPKKTKITSLAFFFTTNFCKQFKTVFQTNNKITRSTNLPAEHMDIITSLNLTITTYGDLAFAKLMANNDPSSIYNELFKKLDEVGFDINILETLE